MRAALLALVLAACGDNEPPDVHIITAPDAAIDAPPDACVREPSDGCCLLLPDVDAAVACAAEGLDDGCAILVCWSADCTLSQFPFCTGEAR